MQIQSETFQRLRDRIDRIRVQNLHNDDELDMPETMNTAAWLNHCERRQPLLCTLLRIDQRRLESLLEMLARWINPTIHWYTTNKQWYPKWVFSTLVCLQLPLEGQVISSLREIAKASIEVRKQFSADQDDDVTPLNLIISLTSQVFHQIDLV